MIIIINWWVILIVIRFLIIEEYLSMQQKANRVTPFRKLCSFQGRVLNEATPEHIARLFATYQCLNELTIGGGVNYQSEWSASRYSAVSARQDDYLLVNLMASYPISDTFTVAVNADNALDKKCYSYLSAVSNRCGEPRNMRITLRANF
jgi:iron complex outermembrane receptor protein/outer membrane receptor for ferric coprogen and ferric-rhodotorulic acid